MKGHLHSLICFCGNLRVLHTGSVGQDDFPGWKFSAKRERERYQELARFIESVRSTLEVIILDFGTEPDEPYIGDCRSPIGCIRHVGRPMDGRFIDLILPILCRGPWHRLRVMKIVDIGGRPTQTALHRWYTPEDPAVFASAEARVRNSLSKGVEVK